MHEINVRSLLAVHDKRNILRAKKIFFTGVDGEEVYNITSPFRSAGHEYIAGRVEPREKELESKIIFFIKKGDKWVPDKNAPVFNLQDPFISTINDELIFGGVEIIIDNGMVNYLTAFFRGKDVYHLKRFAEGPPGMKDIRLILLPQGEIGLFTRPQGIIGGRGRIGFMKIPSLLSLTQFKKEDYFKAPLLLDNLPDEEWLGPNVIYILKNGAIGVLGHIACYTRGIKKKLNKNYYITTFVLDQHTNTSAGMKIILERNNLPQGQSKLKTLKNVLIPGGLVRHDNGTATMYIGASDAESYEIEMIDPFLEYELEK